MSEGPIKILAGGYSVCSSSWGKPVNYTVPYFRLYFIVKGSAVVSVNGIDYPLESGNAYFIPGGYRSNNACPNGMELHWLHCVPATFSLDTLLAKISKVHRWELKLIEFWEPVFTKLGKQNLSVKNGEWYTLQALVIYMISKLLTIYENDPETSNRTYLQLKPAIDFMDREYINNPSLKEIAQKVNLAPNYFHRKFKELLINLTPHAYMERKRLYDARSLVLTTDNTLQEIADKVGYENAFYFSRSFKKCFGVSPSSIRKKSVP